MNHDLCEPMHAPADQSCFGNAECAAGVEVTRNRHLFDWSIPWGFSRRLD
jgi:hypothetical protein